MSVIVEGKKEGEQTMNVALVGTGYIAGRHAAALSAMDDVTIVGHVDVSAEGAQKAADQWGGRAYTALDDLLAHEQCDAVWLCVPPFAHGDLERTLLQHGIPMYIEKPVGVDVAQPEALAAEIADKAAIVNVGYYWRCMEIMPKLQQMLADTPPRMVRLAYHGPTAPAPWWQIQAKGGGQVVEQATHLVDTARFLLGEGVVLSANAAHHDRPAYPNMDIATATTALLEFEGGLPGAFTATCVLDSFVDTTIEFFCDGRKITLSLKELHIDTAEGRTTEQTGEDPLILADRAFIAAVTNDDRSLLPCPYDAALATQKLCYDIQAKAV
ncbi:MAG TPA: Gfo/Idh/MocA family oxidoreductase [Candidatus Saccharimonadales bacterium]|nr:Gfo/Idh/MocA family oxidoreductase [Candidatus Saccharimonadales bacterium]